ncbi:hypothetical protein NQ314_007299 [Rhamnusium bicolor]|uniref:BTB domain-containing protein n=1 Tax=Rhamnusium bicolor TaxID=1586634 RepID=A0AAV8YQQ1_9CUCU|nr:hypothetical protein NQ314_007299 [Rhamnusium bicolor]
MFNGDMKEHGSPEVEIHDMDPTAIDLLLDYAYTGQITITADNVQVLLPASSLLQMNEVREACCRFLLRQLHPTNCLGIRSFADTHSCKELHLKSHVYALQNFQQVVGTEEFLLLPFEEVNDLVSNSQLNISSEEDVFTAVLNWVKHDLAERSQYVARNISSEYFGGGSLFAIHSECEVYNPKSDTWSAIAPMQWRRSRSGVTGLRRLLYVVGGLPESNIKSGFKATGILDPSCDNEQRVDRDRYPTSLFQAEKLIRYRAMKALELNEERQVDVSYDGASDLATAECYNPLTNIWCSITPMGTKRSCLGICSFDGLIYVCGGYDGASCLSSMERFDPLTGIWCSCPAMNTRRRYCRIAVVENCIYALGGFDSTNYQASVEQFDPREGTWNSVPSMSSRRSSCGVAALNGNLYCIGGNDGTMCMSSGERSTHEVVAIDGFIYAIGGNDGSSSLNAVEQYDPKCNKWVVVSSMSTRRSSVGAAVLECINIEHVLRQTRNS